MRKGIIKYVTLTIALLIIGFNSIYFEKLSEMETWSSDEFDAVAFTQNFWTNELLPNLSEGVELNILFEQLENDPEKAFEDYSRSLGIGNIKYFQVRGEGEVSSVDEDYVTLTNASNKNIQVYLVTEFVYGNAIRDASGKISINDFTNTMHLNLISAEINRKIRNEVLPPFKANVKKGDIVQFTGAIELNQKYLDLNRIEINPTSLTLNK